jgi:hypothetical protein
MSTEIRAIDVRGAEGCHLEEWWEIVGALVGTRMEGSEYEVYVSCHGITYRLSYHRDSAEAAILRKNLRGLEDRTIAILRTDIEDKPLVTRTA